MSPVSGLRRSRCRAASRAWKSAQSRARSESGSAASRRISQSAAMVSRSACPCSRGRRRARGWCARRQFTARLQERQAHRWRGRWQMAGVRTFRRLAGIASRDPPWVEIEGEDRQQTPTQAYSISSGSLMIKRSEPTGVTKGYRLEPRCLMAIASLTGPLQVLAITLLHSSSMLTTTSQKLPKATTHEV